MEGRKRDKHQCEREISIGRLLHKLQPGSRPPIQACVLTGHAGRHPVHWATPVRVA